MGQRDPLVEWQRDGYEMFGQMMASIDDEYVKYVMHSQVQVMPRPALDPGLAGAQYIAPEGPVLGAQAIAGALAAGPAPGEEVVFASADEVGAMANGGARRPQQSVAAAGRSGRPGLPRRLRSSTGSGRNDPCPCGSGKKFKFCHGR